MIKIVLCDDEVRFLEIEKKLIAEYFEDKGMTFSVESYSSGEELLKDEAMLKTADLIILDVEMKGIDGITEAKKIREQNDKVNRAVRFILKTMDDIKDYLFECLDCVVNNLNLIDKEITLDFTIGKRSLRINDIAYLKTVGNYTTFVLSPDTKESYMIRYTLKKLTDMLKPCDFIAVSSNETVNLRHVQSVSRYLVVLDNGEEIPVSQKKYNDVFRAYTLFRGKTA